LAALAILALGWIAALVVLGGSDLIPWVTQRLGSVLVVVLATLALCLLPGMALLRWLWAGPLLPWPERLSSSFGLGIGLPALLLMLFHLLHLPWPGWMTFVYLALAAVALLIPRRQSQPTMPLQTPTPLWVVVALIGLTITALLGRLYTISDLIVGANADAFHHTLIAQLLAEHNGLFTNWAPYAPLTTFTYHYGFHACVTFVYWLTGIPIPGLLPIVGQVFSAAAIPAIYTLTSRLTGRPAAGVWAAVLIGFVNTQPAYYAFWSRYPLIASHILLIAILICWKQVVELPKIAPRLILLTGIACASLAHTHYQTTLLAALLIGSALAVMLVRTTTLPEATTLLARVALIGLVALILAAPWLANTIAGNLDRNVAFNSDRQSGEVFAGVPLPPLVPFYLKGTIVLLALGGLFLALRQRNWRTVMLAIWALLSLASVLPYLFGLPGTGTVEPSVAPLTLYLMIGPLAGYLLGSILTFVGPVPKPSAPKWWRILQTNGPIALALVAVVLISAWGIGWQRSLVPLYARMVMPADQQAMVWVQANTPSNARFLVNSHPLYGGLMLVGTDAGWWLPLLANRQVSVPPLTYGSELSAQPEFAQQTQRLAEYLRRGPLSDGRGRTINAARSDAIPVLQAAGITYVYLGAQPMQGPGTFTNVDRIDPKSLRASPNFRLVYDAGGVTIFELVRR
jgi:hypothetical protein